MSLTVDDITTISRAIAAEQSPAIEIVGVASNLGEGRVELLVNIDGRSQPERLLLNLSRNDRSAFEQALKEKLREALLTQRT
jgi:acylphosphatase